MHTPENMKTHRVDGHTSRLSLESRRLTGQAGQIAQAARALYEKRAWQKPPSKTSPPKPA